MVITFLSFRIIIFTKDTKELVEPVEGTDKYRKTFSFYVYEKTLEAHDHQIKLIGGMSFPVNLLTAIAAAIGMVGVLKKIPILVRIWAYNLAFYLGWWASWVSKIYLNTQNLTTQSQAVIEPGVLATDFTIPPWAVVVATIAAVLLCAACMFFVYWLTVLASQICAENEKSKVQKIFVLNDN